VAAYQTDPSVSFLLPDLAELVESQLNGSPIPGLLRASDTVRTSGRVAADRLAPLALAIPTLSSRCGLTSPFQLSALMAGTPEINVGAVLRPGWFPCLGARVKGRCGGFSDAVLARRRIGYVK
jgi:hypothetical protein